MKILLDVDTGVDDAIGLLYLADAHRLGKTNILAAGTVAGNASLAQTTRNTLKVFELAKLNVPVAQGAEQAMLTSMETVSHIHGSDGLADTNLTPPSTQPSGEHAADQLLRLSHEYEGELTLLTFAPLTNIGIAMLRDPALAQRLKKIIIMGGSLSVGNRTPGAEANIYDDPEAARIVFRSGADITMVGLDVTNQTYFLKDELAPLKVYDNERAKFVLALINFMIKAYDKMGYGRRFVLHDPLSAGVCLSPDLVTTEKLHLDVETRGELTRGMTLADRRAGANQPPNINVALEVDAERFKVELMEALLRWVKED